MKFYIKSLYRPRAGMAKILLVMKLIIVLLTAAILQVSASSFAQKITLSEKNTPLQQVLKKIKGQTGYEILYMDNQVEQANKVSLQFKDLPLDIALEQVFKNQPLSYEIKDRTVIVKLKEPSLLDKLSTVISNIVRDLTVKGKVVDQDGKPLPNASIRVKGKSAVTNTNQNGEFEIKGVDENAVLLVSYVGFRTLEIPLQGAVMPLEIKLNVQTGELQEVKVIYNTGYQELELKKATGSVVQIDNELFNRQTGTNVLDRIYNITSGLISNNQSLGPSRKNDITIRGTSSLNSISQKPLIVVDNFPYEGDLNALNPNDVESVTVLKDAAASAIWGARAGNGVIVINTKKGRFNQATQSSIMSNITIVQKPDLFYTPYMSSSDIIDLQVRLFNTGQYNVYDDLYPSIGLFISLPQAVELLLAGRKAGIADPASDPVIKEKLTALTKNDVRNDINKYMLRNNLNQQYAFNLSGGGSKYTYYVGGGFDRNQNADLKDNTNRLSINLQNTFKPINGLIITTSLVHARSGSNSSGNSYAQMLPQVDRPIYNRLADEQGKPLVIPNFIRTTYLDTVSYPGLFDWHYYPLHEYDFRKITGRQSDTRFLASVNYSLIQGLTIGLDYQNQQTLSDTRDQQMQASFVIRNQINQMMSRSSNGVFTYPYPLGDFLQLQKSEFSAWNLRGKITLDKNWGNHSIRAIAATELRASNSDVNTQNLYGFDPETNTSKAVSFTQAVPVLRPGGGSMIIGTIINPTGYTRRNGSQLANVEYSYKGKYLLSASGRIDQANIFGTDANLRRKLLWSTGLAWNMHQEKFYHLEWLPYLKLKASYGYTGNVNPNATSYPTFQYQTAESSIPPRNIASGVIG